MIKATLIIKGKSTDVEITNSMAKVISDALLNTDIMDRIKEFNDILDYHGLSEESFNESIKNDSASKAALARCELISLAFNGGIPLTDDETWWQPLFKRPKSGSGFSNSYTVYWNSRSVASVGARLTGFREKKHSDYAGKLFEETYAPLL